MKHNIYFDGNVQSLGFSIFGEDVTVGVIEPGEYDFGLASREEQITVLAGALFVHGVSAALGTEIHIAKGEQIVLKAVTSVAYICRYKEECCS